MKNLIPPKIGDEVPYHCPDCGEQFFHIKLPFPLPIKCPKCGKMKCKEDSRICW